MTINFKAKSCNCKIHLALKSDVTLCRSTVSSVYKRAWISQHHRVQCSKNLCKKCNYFEELTGAKNYSKTFLISRSFFSNLVSFQFLVHCDTKAEKDIIS